MGKTAKLTTNELALLEKALTFGTLPSTLKMLFLAEKVVIADSATIIKVPKLSRWYVIDNSKRFLRIFFIEILDFRDQKIRIGLSQETPTYSDNINDYPIYRVGIPFTNIHISGQEREKLRDNRQLQKWDYFFQASRQEVGYKHRDIISKFEQTQEKYEEKLFNEGLKTGGLIVGALIIFWICWFVIALALVGYLFYRFKNLFIQLFYNYRDVTTLRKSIDKLVEEQTFLENEVNQNNVSVEQMVKWLEEEIKELDYKAVKDLNLPEDKIIRRGFTDKLNTSFDFNHNILGLRIQEYGFVQPLSANGKKKLERKHPHHLLAYKHKKGKALVGVYYIYFIYMTPETIGISGFFYDFILAKRFGQTTTQYYYRDIVGIGTAVADTKVFSNQEEWETEQVILSFYNSERISIALTDKVAIENLREQIEEKKEDNLDIDIDNSDLDQLIGADNDELPGTKARFILETVKTYWNQKKNGGLPPSGETGLLD